MRSRQLQSLAVKVLRAVYGWSERHYRRELFRQALWEVSREIAARRRLKDRGGDAKTRGCQGAQGTARRRSRFGFHMRQARRSSDG